jgi:N-acylneuraminate cytidylyltransferase/CMP-N,N'-diacetyllegionaminic acid synthase
MTKTKKIMAVIPARGGSKGVPRKNTRTLNGRPLISYIINSAKQSKHIDKLIISTEDEDIMQIGRGMGVDIPFKRPPELASDNTPLIAVILHAYNYFKERNTQYDAVLSLQPTCPFLQPKSIDNMIELWIESVCESVVTISEITKGHPYIAKDLLSGHIIKNFCPIPEGAIVGPRQKRRKAYYLTGGVYLRDKRLLEITETKGHALGSDTRAVVVDEIEAVDINSELDLKFAELLINLGQC